MEKNFLDLYRDDIKKTTKRYSSKVSAVFENIPGSLSSHEKKIVLYEIDDSNAATFSKYDEPLFWLDDSMICNKNESSVKCYMGDTARQILRFSL